MPQKEELAVSFYYDCMNRLTMENRREGEEKCAYDLVGNRLKKQRYHYALTTDGNMDSVIDDEESYCYNERNELENTPAGGFDIEGGSGATNDIAVFTSKK